MLANLNPAQPAQPQKPVVPPVLLTTGQKIKKLLMLFGIVFGGLSVLFLTAAFYFMSIAEKGKTIGMFGDSTPSILNILVAGVYIVFLFWALVGFIAVMVPLFKMMLTKKEDVEKTQKAKKHLIISGILLFVLLIGWFVAFFYLENRREVLELNLVHASIETDPVETLQLSAPVEVKFDATYADYGKDKFKVILYNWDFGDGTKEIGNQIVTHEFTQKGDFIVTLTIEKRNILTGEEAQDKFSKEVSITDQALTASFTATPDSGEAPLLVKFDASASADPDGKITKYEWDIDGNGVFDGTYDNKDKPEYTYDKIGTYEVTLRVTSVTGGYAVTKKQIVVNKGENPVAVIEIANKPELLQKGASYVFSAEKSTTPNGKITKYEWDFGDGSILESTKNVNHTFTKEGVFNITLKITDDVGKEGETILPLTIGEKPGFPQAIITTTPAIAAGALAIEGEAPFKVSFDGSGSKDSKNDIVEYDWDFNNDRTTDSYGKTAEHTFENSGTYTVKLTVKDAEGNESFSTVGVKVVDQGIKAKVSATPSDGEVPLTVTFDATASTYPQGDITSFKWDFGDKTAPVIGSGKINHKYSSIGEYTAEVTAIGKDNSRDTEQVFIVVRAVQVSSCFAPTVKKGPAPLSVTFDPDCSSGTIKAYSWTFGDGATSADIKPTHSFEKTGVYPVTLEVTDNDNNVAMTTVEIVVE